MNILIVFAHPEPKSLNGQLRNFAYKYLRELGHKVEVSDLFQLDFKSAADRGDFPTYPQEFFDLQSAQQEGQLTGKLPEDTRKEQGRLLWADLIIFSSHVLKKA